MIYRLPRLTEADHAVIALLDRQRQRLRAFTDHAPRRWLGSLRRTTFARAIQGSNSIEGYHATLDQAVEAVEGEPTLDERTETWLAITGYRNALTYILQAAQDPFFEFSRQFLKSLHFMMLGHDMAKSPGRWRPGPVSVIREPGGEEVYIAPDAALVDDLVGELVATLRAPGEAPLQVRAAMAHLNLTMIHPFRDGNGRMARALQTLVLAQDGLLHPVFASIEEWLGRNTDAYYGILAETGQGRWNPGRDALPWIRFCLRAHHQQAETLIRRNEEYETLYRALETLVAKHRGTPDRALLPLFDAALGLRLTNQRYRSDAEVSELVASRDLKRLVDAGLLEPHGEKRGRSYRAAEPLRALRRDRPARSALADPYTLVAAAAGPRLPGL
jgi:Fic family protein